jgi:hypothetical protein
MLLRGFYRALNATPSSGLTYLATEDDREKYIVQYTEATINTSEKCLFVAQRGYIGIGSPEVRKGNNVCVLLGCDNHIPLVIR